MRSVLFDTSMQIWAHAYFGTYIRHLAERALELVKSLTRTKGEATRQYLARVTVCYLHDLRPELAVMARAVVEAALESCDLEAHLDVILEVQRKRHPGLGDRIQAARMAGILSPEALNAATKLKDAGDDAIHSLPQQAPSSSDTLAGLMTVLEALDEAGSITPPDR